jgi:hypothetical protein
MASLSIASCAMRPALPVVMAVLAAAFAGCGAQASSAGDFEGEEKAVAEAVEDIQSAGERQDTDKLCDELLTKALADRIAEGGESCTEEGVKAVDDANDFDLDATDVTVDGTRAEAKVENKQGEQTVTTTFELVKEGDQWKLDSIAPAQ